MKHAELARLISSVASERGAVADRGTVQEVRLAVASRPDEIDVAFWRAVLGYDPPAPTTGSTPAMDRRSGSRSSTRPGRRRARGSCSDIRSVVVRPWVNDAARMKPIEFEIQRTIRAPIDEVFARLVDIDGHNDWMAGTGSMLKHTRQTSPGEPTIGTTFVDETSQGAMPGEISEMERPHTIVFHWWEKSKSGKLKFEGWLSYHLQPSATRRPWSATAATCCPTGCGAWTPDLATTRRQGADHHSRRAEGVLRAEPTLGSWLNTLLVVPCGQASGRGDDLPTADLVGDIEPLAMYVGQSSGIVDSVQPAAVIAQTLAADAQQVLNRLAAKNT